MIYQTHTSCSQFQEKLAQTYIMTTTAIVPYVGTKEKWTEKCRKHERAMLIGGRRYVLEQGKWNGEEFREKFGTAVYDASIVLSHYIADHNVLKTTKCKHVIELGCGVGLVSIVASTLLSETAQVVATDYDSKLLELVERNASKNLKEKESKRLRTKVLKWGSTCPKDGENVDLILGSDIVACPYAEALPLLVKTLCDLMSNGARAIIAYKPRLKSEDIFFQLAREKFDIKWIGRSKIHRDFNKRVGVERIAIFILTRKK
jgi:predicted nicotinamide N-methyase